MGIIYYPPPSSGGGGGVSDHGLLTGLGDDDHTQYLLVGGGRAMAGALNMGTTNKIINLANPTNDQDAATKIYVDGVVVTDHGSLDGLSDDDHPQYLLGDGSRAMTGALDLGTHKIANVVDPTLDQDAATKSYVDSEIAGLSVVTDHGALSGLSDDDHPQYLLVDGTRPMSDGLDMGDHRVFFVADPIEVHDATRKDYVDNGDAAVAAMIITDHGSLSGLSDDDHTQYLLVAGTRAMTGALNMGTTNKIINLADPTLDQDAATKSYVDTAVGGITVITDHGALSGLSDDDHPQYLLASGARVMSGALNMNTANKIINLADPTLAQDAATKAYVDSEIGSISFDHGNLTGLSDDDHPQYLKVDGTRAMTDTLNMGGNLVSSVATPVGTADATTKGYVDGEITATEVYADAAADAAESAANSYTDSQVVTDHGALTGLSDDDHTQYLRADGTRALTGDLSMGSNKLTNVADPTSAQDAVTKAYADALRVHFVKFEGTSRDASFTAQAGYCYSMDIGYVTANVQVTFPSSPTTGDVFGFFVIQPHIDALASSGTFTQLPFYCVEPANGTVISGEAYTSGTNTGSNKWGLWLTGELLIFHYTGIQWDILIDGRIPHGAGFWASSAQTISNNTVTAMNGPGELFDNYGGHSTSTTNYYTIIKRAGLYGLSGSSAWASNGTGERYVQMQYNNGSGFSASGTDRRSPASFGEACLSSYENLARGAVCQMVVYQNTGGNLNLLATSSNHFQLVEIL